MLPAPLLADTVALLLAPALAWALSRRPALEAFAHGLSLVAVGGLVLLHVVPFGIANAGAIALGALVLGGLFGALAHRVPRGESAVRGVALLALAVHGLVDGAAFATDHAHGGSDGVGWAVVAHSVPVGLATWRVGVSAGGTRVAIGLLVVSIVTTWVGWWGADLVFSELPRTVLAIAQCLVAGGLLHVVSHLDEEVTSQPVAGLGALVGLGGLLWVGGGEAIPSTGPDALNFQDTLVTLFLATAPMVVLAYLATSALYAFLPPRAADRLAEGNPHLPTVLVSLLMSVPILGLPATLAWASTVAIVASTRLGSPAADSGPPTHRSRAHAAARVGLVDTVERTAPWILAGLLFAALAESLLVPTALAVLPSAVLVAAGALAGVPVALSVAGVTPVLAVLLHKGLGVGAAIACLVTAPFYLGLFSDGIRHEGASVSRHLGVAAIGVAVGFAAEVVVPHASVPTLASLASLDPTPLAIPSTVLLAILFAAALLRRGPGGFLEPLMPGGDRHEDHFHPAPTRTP